MSEQIKLIPGKNADEAMEIDTDHPLCEQSKLIKGLIEQQNYEDGVEVENPKDKAVLEKVLAFAVYMKDHESPKIEKPIPEPIRDFKDIPDMPAFFTTFLSCDKYGLSDLMMAAIDLELDTLRELIGAKVCLEIRGMTVQQIRDYYEFTPEEIGFTPEEEELNMEELECAKLAYGDKWMNNGK